MAKPSRKPENKEVDSIHRTRKDIGQFRRIHA
jgi:hypothetical protein